MGQSPLAPAPSSSKGLALQSEPTLCFVRIRAEKVDPPEKRKQRNVMEEAHVSCWACRASG